MAMGKGIAASRLGQIKDIMIDNENALLTEPGNVDSLSQAIVKLSKDSQLRERLGKTARRDVVEKYTWKKNAERVMDSILNTIERD